MDDEFKLCWKNFQDNIASGFQSLYDRGDLVDVTLACDGKLLQAHKIVLAICSPYFQEIFISNPCKHPIIILKDVSYNIMCELLEFMYQGVVNVKHIELQAFMKIGQLLQIKGLATNSSSSAASTTSDKSSCINQTHIENDETLLTTKSLFSSANETTKNEENSNVGVDKSSLENSNPNTPQRPQSPVSSQADSPINQITTNPTNKSNETQPSSQHPQNHGISGISAVKRHLDYSSDSLSIYSRNKLRRSITSAEHSNENIECPETGSSASAIEQMNTDDFFLPHVSMVESRYELNNIKRESSDHHQNSSAASAAAVAAASASLRNSFNSSTFGLDYSFYKNSSASSQSSQDYPNELLISNEYSKSFANHMDIPPNCPNVVMLSSTSLLHGSCVFNRNNTVATQQGMKTYWLCKSYRISMCRARCITHQGKIISATGVHNHPPHMRSNSTTGGGSGSTGCNSSGNTGSNINNSLPPPSPHVGNSSGGGLSITPSSSGMLGLRYPQNAGSSGNINHQNYHDQHYITPSPPSSTFATNPHMHSSNTNNSNVAPPHPFLQSMPNLLVQHYPGSQPTQLMQQPTFPTPHHVLHNYEISPAMQSSSSVNLRNTNTSVDPNDKPLSTHGKEHFNDDNIPVHNAALSPPGIHNTGIKSRQAESLTHDNEMGKKMPSSEHHQVQVIDSITISPGSGHNFKMESI